MMNTTLPTFGRVVEASFVAAAAPGSTLPAPTLAEVSFAGRSNVGKSSLLNVLTSRKGLVRAGSTPGTTRQLNLFLVKMADGLALHLVDLPGYGYAKRSRNEKARWGPLIEGYLANRVTLRAIVLLVDVRRGLEQEERELLEFLAATANPGSRPPVHPILVATKIDKIGSPLRANAISRIAKGAGVRPIAFSAQTGEGREELWRAIYAATLGTP
jgi:GTP-binding protein